MNAVVLLAKAHRHGASFAAIDARLVVEAPAPLPDVLVAELRAHKGELLALLTPTHKAGRDLVFDWWQERAAIMEYDGGLAREEAERQAWKRALVYFDLPVSYLAH